MKKLASDIEVYEEVFHITFYNIVSKQMIHLTWSPWHPPSSAKVKLLQYMLNSPQHLIIGYNWKEYDNVILRYIAFERNWDINPPEIKQFSDFIFNDKSWNKSEIGWKIFPRSKRYKSFGAPWCDVQRLHRLQHYKKSLKAVGINVKSNNIDELPFPPDHRFNNIEEVRQLVTYCGEDCIKTGDVYKYSLPELKTRIGFAEQYPERRTFDYFSYSRSNVSRRVLKFWIKKRIDSDIPLEDYKKEANSYGFYGNAIVEHELYNFKTPQTKELIEKIDNFFFDIPDQQREIFHHSLEINNTKYTIGEGGIHSKDDAVIYRPNEDYAIVYGDVQSYYPNIIIFLECVAPYLKPIIQDIKTTLAQRVHAKMNGIKTLDAVLKIVLNALSGMLGDKYSDIFHKYSHLRMLLNGQLGMLDIAEDLALEGWKVISINTDGIAAVVPRKQLAKCKSIFEEWNNRTGYKLSFDELDVYAATAANNYIYKIGKKVSGVGIFREEPRIEQGCSHLVVRKALREYILSETPPEAFINEHDNIHDFFFSQKTAKKFDVLFERPGCESIKLQNVNRWYAAKAKIAGIINKYEDGVWKGKLSNGENVYPANTITSIDPKDYPMLNKTHYIDMVYKNINKMKINNYEL